MEQKILEYPLPNGIHDHFRYLHLRYHLLNYFTNILSFLIMSSESFPIKEKRIRIRFPFCRRCVIMHGYRVQCASARCFGRIHPHQIIQYPGIAKLVSRLVWECVDPIHARLGQKPGMPCGTGDSGFFPGCRKRHKCGFDHRNDHRQKKLYFYPSPWYHGRKVNNRVWLNW